MCLAGKRRNTLKISSLKEIIRLLAAIPSDENIKTIFREWQRDELHRDVRIAILISAMRLLKVKIIILFPSRFSCMSLC